MPDYMYPYDEGVYEQALTPTDYPSAFEEARAHVDRVLHFCYDYLLPVFLRVNGESEGAVLCWNDVLNQVESRFGRRVYDFQLPREHSRLNPFVHAAVEHHLTEWYDGVCVGRPYLAELVSATANRTN